VGQPLGSARFLQPAQELSCCGALLRVDGCALSYKVHDTLHQAGKAGKLAFYSSRARGSACFMSQLLTFPTAPRTAAVQ